MDGKVSVLLEEHPPSTDVAIVRKGLRDFNISRAGNDNHRKLTIFLRDSDNQVVGGLLGGTYWGYLYIEALWITDKYRHQGYGHCLLSMAEEEAVKRKCRYAHLDTHDFQEVAFYQKHGYVIVGKLENLPPGFSKYLMKKGLLYETEALPGR